MSKLSVSAAEKAGRKAYKAGLIRLPSGDPGMRRMIGERPIHDKDMPFISAWLHGWDEANLSAPVPGWTRGENLAMQKARRRATSHTRSR
jgi:hypothetical protein